MVFQQSEWLHQYEACGEYIQKMTPDDFLEFVHAVTFSKQIISQVCVGVFSLMNSVVFVR